MQANSFLAVYARSYWPSPGVSGIYAIVNTASGKAYIGCSGDIRQRWYDHLSKLRAGRHQSWLQSAWNKYGESVFRFVVLERCDRSELLDAEDWWIAEWNQPGRTGYNRRPRRAANNAGMKFSPESLERCSRASLVASARRRALGLKRRPDPPEVIAKRKSWWNTEAGLAQREWLKRQNAARVGLKWTDSQRAAYLRVKDKIRAGQSAALKGKPWSQARRDAWLRSRRAGGTA